jgi:hypothetical protein
MAPEAFSSHEALPVLDRSIALHNLTFLDEDGEVTVGRTDIDSYAILPPEGAALLRRLGEGMTPREAATWYEGTYGETADIEDFLSGIAELGFIRAQHEDTDRSESVRWQRLGRAVFSPVSGVLFLLLLIACGVLLVRDPVLRPTYHQFFFTKYLTLLTIGLFLIQFPLILVHESAHALAGRRLGLSTRLSLGRRLYFIVLETSMDGLVTVSRRQRFLPMLAGVLADLAIYAIFVIVASLTLHEGRPTLFGTVALAIAIDTLLRAAWQFYFHLQTDMYYVAATVFKCADLQTVARQMLRNRLHRLLGYPRTAADESGWHPRDRTVARWYSWLLLVGNAFSIGTLLFVVVPSTIRFIELDGRALAGGAGVLRMVDGIVALSLIVGQFVVAGWLARRSRRQRRSSLSNA